jgi:hypothetical protein
MIRSPAGFDGEDRIKRYLDYYQPSYGVMMLSAGQFSPAALFAAGEQGVWYDPSDLTTMFQDAAGTTPVTAVEQPVGLRLDKSRGLVLGSELITNGDFATDTDWTKATGWSISGGVASYDGTDAPNAMYQTSAALVAPKSYRVTITVTLTQGALLVRPQYNTTVGQYQINSSGTYTIILRGQSAGGFGVIAGSSGVRFIGSIDNISVRELPGSHAYQTTDINRPVLAARINALVATEDFSSASWSVGGTATKTASTNLDPDGTQTAWRITCPASGDSITQSFTAIAATYNGSIWVRSRTGVNQVVGLDISGSTTITATPTWTLHSVSSSVGAGSRIFRIRYVSAAVDVDVWHPDVRVSTEPSSLPAYQRVAASTDYDTTGFPLYLRYNGTNSTMQTAAIDFTSTDKMSVFAGVRKLSDAAVGILVELSATVASNAGSFVISAPNSTGASGNYGFYSRGSVAPVTLATSATTLAPVTSVLTAEGSITGDLMSLRTNGVSGTNSTLDQGTGNYGNYPLYLGARNAASNWFNGRDYGLVVLGRTPTAAEITSMEAWMNARAKAY